MPKQLLLTAVLSVACLGPAYAQDAPKPDKIVLEAKVGSVLTSTGGDFQSVENGKLLVQGESMMLSDGAKANVVYYYGEGTDMKSCVEKYTGPNTVVIDDSCKKAAALWGSSNPGGTALIVGGVVVAAALLASGNDDDDAPISAGAR